MATACLMPIRRLSPNRIMDPERGQAGSDGFTELIIGLRQMLTHTLNEISTASDSFKHVVAILVNDHLHKSILTSIVCYIKVIK